MWNCDTSNAIKKQKTTNDKQTPLWFSIILFHNTHKDMKTQSGFHVVCWREPLNQVYYHHFSITRTMSGYVSSVSVGFLFSEVMIAKTPITDQHFTILLCLKEKKKGTRLGPNKTFSTTKWSRHSYLHTKSLESTCLKQTGRVHVLCQY